MLYEEVKDLLIKEEQLLIQWKLMNLNDLVCSHSLVYYFEFNFAKLNTYFYVYIQHFYINLLICS